MLKKILDPNKIITALFIVSLFAIGAFGTAKYAGDSDPSLPEEQTTGIVLPTDLSAIQREIEAPQLNDTKAMLTVVLGGVIVAAVVGMGVLLAFGFWLLNKLLKALPSNSG